MERHPRQIHVRMSEGEVKRAKALARSLDTTLSDLIRTLLQLPASSIEEGGSLVVIDRATAVKLAREMRRWGHHYNQAVHALNAIAYYLRANDMDVSDVLEELDRTSGMLAAMQPGIEALRLDAEAISQRVIAGIGR
jgi:ABC-type transporter Mla subunit MlaD